MQREFDLHSFLIHHQAKPAERSWVKAFTYEPAEEELVATRGKMYAVLSVGSAVPLDFGPIMQLIMESLHRDYFGKTEGGILPVLETALDGIHKQLILTAQKDKRLGSGFNFNLLVAVSWGTTLYFGQLGASRASLMRGGRLFDIDEGPQKTTGLYLSSGEVKAGDKVLLATEELMASIDRDVLVEHMKQEDGREMVKAIEAEIGAGEPEAAMKSGMILQIDIRQVPTVEDEGLMMASSDVGRSMEAPRESKITAWGAGLSAFGSRLWRWRVGKIPGLALVVVVGAALVLLSSFIFSDTQPRSTVPVERNQAFEDMLVAAEKHIEDARIIMEVNPDRSYDLLEEAGEWLQSGRTSYPDDEQLQRMLSQREELERELLMVEELSTERLVTLEVKPSQAKLAVVGGKIFILDADGQRLSMVGVEGGEVSHSTASNRFSNGSLLAAGDARLLLTDAGQGFSVSTDGEVAGGRGIDSLTQIEAIAGYMSNGYALSRAGQVVRITLEDSGVGSMSDYFEQPLGGAYIDLAIDGDVYLLGDTGEVERYRGQVKQDFQLERGYLLKSPRAILTSREADLIMVVEGNRLLLWDKDGGYVGQRVMSGEGELGMVGVDAAMETVYILSNNGVFRAGL